MPMKTALLCLISFVLMLSLTHAHADDRAKQRAEDRIFTQMEKYEAWQEEIERELETLWDRAERLRQMGQVTRHSGKLAPFAKQFVAQEKKVERSRDKGWRILSRIQRACERIAEQWPPAPPECQEEYQALRDFQLRTRKRVIEAGDHAG